MRTLKQHISLIYESVLSVGEIEKKFVGTQIQRHTELKRVIDEKEPLETKKGKVVISFLTPEQQAAFNSGDFKTAFQSGRRYIPAFKTEKGDEITLQDIIKTAKFGGGRGSGGGAENTKLTESAQCVISAQIMAGENYEPGDAIDFKSLKSNDYDVDENISKIESDLTDDWVDSSILIGNALKKYLGSGKWKFHRGSQFVKNINETYKRLVKLEEKKPFSDINKWNPADIWCTNGGENFDFEKYTSLGDWNNDLKELHDKRKLVGVSLKKAVKVATLQQKNTTGFIRRPVKYKDYLISKKGFFKAKYSEIITSAFVFRIRSFVGEFGGYSAEVLGTTAFGGKVGITEIFDSLQKHAGKRTKYPDRKLISIIKRPTPAFKQELWEMYLGLKKDNEFTEKTKDKFMKELDRFFKINPSFIFNRYRAMEIISLIKNAGKAKSDRIIDSMAAYSLAEGDLSGPHVLAK